MGYYHGINPAYQLSDRAQAQPSRVRDRNSRRILEATRAFVEQHGLEQLSMRRLANHIDVSVNTIYNLFGDKRGLIASLVQHSLDAVGIAALDITATDPIERVWQVVTISVDTMSSLPKAVVVAVMADDELDGRLDWRGHQLVTDALRSAMKTGALRDDLAPEVLVDQAGAVYYRLLHKWASSKIGVADLRAAVLQAYDVTLLAVARPQARRRLLDHLVAPAPTTHG